MEELLTYLNTGKANAVSRKTLTQLLGIQDRVVRRNIAELRAKGVPIASNTKTGGYYLPANEKEAEEYIHSMNSRAINTFKSIKATKEWLKKNKNINIQLDIF